MNVHVDTVCDKCNYKKSKYENPPPPKLVIVPFCMYVFQYGLGWSMIHDPLWQYRTSVGDDEQLRRYDAFGASGPLLIAMKIFLP